MFVFDSYPLAEPRLESCLCDLHTLFTAHAAAEEVVAWATDAPAALLDSTRLLLLWYHHLARLTLTGMAPKLT